MSTLAVDPRARATKKEDATETDAVDASACFHCGLPVPDEASLTARIDDRDVPVCCPGCAAAVGLVADAGLDDYYRLRERSTGIRAGAPASIEDRCDFSSPAVAEHFVTVGEHGDSAEIAVDGMRCAACSWLLENGLDQLKGVREVQVELAAGRATVRWDPAAADLGRVMDRVRELGFECAPAHASEEEAMLAEQRHRSLRALGIAGVVAMQVMMLAVADYAGLLGSDMAIGYRATLLWGQMVLASVAVFFASGVFMRGALRALRARRLTMDVPVALAIGLAYSASLALMFSGAPASGAHLYFDSVTMFVFLLLLGRHLELGIRHRFARSDAHLGALLPSAARRIEEDGLHMVPAEGLRTGDHIRVRPGEIVAADGRLTAGSGVIDRSALTGESAPVAAVTGAQIEAGARSIDGVLDLEVLRPAAEAAVAGIPAMLDRARRGRPRAARLADLVASRFLAGVLILAAVAGVIWTQVDPSRALEVVLATLIVTCPCALSLATPSAITAAAVRLRRKGVLVADPDAFETLAQCREICFDKTGTLTEPLALEVRRIAGDPFADQVAAILEQDVDHPLAHAFVRLGASSETQSARATDLRVVPGEGIEGTIEAQRWRIGRASFCDPDTTDDDAVHLCCLDDPAHSARYRVTERLQSDVREVLDELRSLDLEISMLSGDDRERTAAIALELGIDIWCAEARPDDKLDWLSTRMGDGRHIVYVGDGINDAPVLGGASASVAVGSASAYAQSAADAVLLDRGLDALPELIRTARATRRRIRINLGWALGYNSLAIPLALAGLVTPWLAAIGMSASSLVVMLGSASLLREDTR